jgi:dephospho-CoA kinase
VSEKRGIASRPKRRPLVIGLTGNFGAGKSTVASLFKKKGARVLSADRLAHEVFRKGNPVHLRVRSLFPQQKGNLSRKRIADIVFQSPQKRRSLEALVHPYVLRRIQDEAGRTKKRVVIVEVPLLFETGFDRGCDRTIVVVAKPSQIFKRLAGRGGFKTRPYTRAQIQARWRAQMPPAEKIGRSDYRIDNSDGLGKTRSQVEKIWKELNKVAQGPTRATRERSLSKHG